MCKKIAGMQYDGGWVISAATPQAAAACGLGPSSAWPLLANGSLALQPAAASASSSSAAQGSSSSSGGLGASLTVLADAACASGLIPSFDFCDVRLQLVGSGSGSGTASDIALSGPTALSLDMHRGVLSATFAAASPHGQLQVTHELRVLMHASSLALHTIVVSGMPSGAPATPLLMRALHSTRAPVASVDVDLSTVAFRGDSVSGSGGPLFVVTGSARTSRGGGALGCSTCFLAGADAALAGSWPAYAVDAAAIGAAPSCTTTVDFAPTSPTSSYSTATLHVLTSAQRSTAEADDPAGALDGLARLRALLQPGTGTGGATPASLVAAHEAAWAARWSTYVDVAFDPAAAPAPAYASDLRRALRLGMWTLHGCGRADGAGLIDVTGRAVLAGRQDDFLTNALVVLRPEAAAAALAARRSQLKAAAAAARLAGLPGAAFARIAPSGSPFRATMLTAVDAWNYFRVTSDAEWLAADGLALLRAAADHAVAAAQQQQHAGLALDVAAAVAALRGACEACYAAGQAPRDAWAALRFSLALPTLSAGALAGTSSPGVPEPLEALAQPLLSLAGDAGVSAAQLPLNLAQWASPAALAAPSPDAGEAAAADLVLLQALAQAAQLSSALADAAAFEAQLELVLQRHLDAGSAWGWGSFAPRAASAPQPSDPSLCAQLLMAVAQGLAGAAVQGGYTPARYQYASLGISTSTNAALPASWERLLLYGLGGATDAVLLNVAGAGGAALQQRLSPWRQNALTLMP